MYGKIKKKTFIWNPNFMYYMYLEFWFLHSVKKSMSYQVLIPWLKYLTSAVTTYSHSGNVSAHL